MGYPMHEDPETAEFWSNAERVQGVRYCGQYYASRANEGAGETSSEGADGPIRGPIRKDSGPGGALYEITTDAAAQTLNQMVADSDASSPWWQKLLTVLYNPWGALRDQIFEMAGDAMNASIAARKYWHEHKFAKGDRIYIAVNVHYPTGITDIYCGCSIMGSDGNRFAQHGGSFSREQMQRIDDYWHALPDPPAHQTDGSSGGHSGGDSGGDSSNTFAGRIVQITFVNSTFYGPMHLVDHKLSRGKWIHPPPESVNFANGRGVCQVSYYTSIFDLGAAGSITYGFGDGGQWVVEFSANQFSSHCEATSHNRADGATSSTTADSTSGLPANSHAWLCTAGWQSNNPFGDH